MGRRLQPVVLIANYKDTVDVLSVTQEENSEVTLSITALVISVRSYTDDRARRSSCYFKERQRSFYPLNARVELSLVAAAG